MSRLIIRYLFVFLLTYMFKRIPFDQSFFRVGLIINSFIFYLLSVCTFHQTGYVRVSGVNNEHTAASEAGNCWNIPLDNTTYVARWRFQPSSWSEFFRKLHAFSVKNCTNKTNRITEKSTIVACQYKMRNFQKLTYLPHPC